LRYILIYSEKDEEEEGMGGKGKNLGGSKAFVIGI